MALGLELHLLDNRALEAEGSMAEDESEYFSNFDDSGYNLDNFTHSPWVSLPRLVFICCRIKISRLMRLIAR